jgi:hypothetical protein
MSGRFILAHAEARRRALAYVAEAPQGWVVSIKPATRSTEQNAKLWAALTDLAEQVNWHGQRLTKEEWKDVMTAGLKRQKVVPGIDGGFVVLGSQTSRMSKGELSDLLELIAAFGAQHEVTFSEPHCEPVVRQHELNRKEPA